MKQKLKEQKIDKLTDMILTESNLEKAEIVLAVKGEIVDKLQRQAEIVSNMSVDILYPLIDRIKAESGVEAADQFKMSVSAHLDNCTKVLLDAKDKISTETLKLTGDIASTSDIESLDSDTEFDNVDLGMDEPTFDFEDDSDFEDLDAPAQEELAEPVEREMKESRRFGVCVETVTGRTGNKYFDSKEHARKWLTENKNQIKQVLKVLK